jgi:hypothetical protein
MGRPIIIPKGTTITSRAIPIIKIQGINIKMQQHAPLQKLTL